MIDAIERNKPDYAGIVQAVSNSELSESHVGILPSVLDTALRIGDEAVLRDTNNAELAGDHAAVGK